MKAMSLSGIGMIDIKKISRGSRPSSHTTVEGGQSSASVPWLVAIEGSDSASLADLIYWHYSKYLNPRPFRGFIAGHILSHTVQEMSAQEEMGCSTGSKNMVVFEEGCWRGGSRGSRLSSVALSTRAEPLSALREPLQRKDTADCVTWTPTPFQINQFILCWYIQGSFHICVSRAPLKAHVVFRRKPCQRIAGAWELPYVKILADISCTLLYAFTLSATGTVIHSSKARLLVWAYRYVTDGNTKVFYYDIIGSFWGRCDWKRPIENQAPDGRAFLLECPTCQNHPGWEPLAEDNCCARAVMSNQPVFPAQCSRLQEEVEVTGNLVLFFPKVHCELDFIERYAFFCYVPSLSSC